MFYCATLDVLCMYLSFLPGKVRPPKARTTQNLSVVVLGIIHLSQLAVLAHGGTVPYLNRDTSNRAVAAALQVRVVVCKGNRRRFVKEGPTFTKDAWHLAAAVDFSGLQRSASLSPKPTLRNLPLLSATNVRHHHSGSTHKSWWPPVENPKMAEQPQIKPDPDAGSPFMDEALDETPDLEFFDRLPEADTYSRMYLARLPSYVWQAWSKLDDDAEIEIGKIRQSTDKDGNLVSLVRPWRCLEWPLTSVSTPQEIANASQIGYPGAPRSAKGV